MYTRRPNVSDRRPWGFWATIGFSRVIVLTSVLAQTVVVIAFGVSAKINHPDIHLYSLGSNGLLLTIATVVSTPPTIAFSLLFARFCRRLPIREYFRLYSPGKRQYFKWLLALLVLALCSDGFSILLGRPIVPDSMVHAYATAHFAPLLWLALIAAAPLGEEIIFRGFLFKGISCSRIGGTGAILISSLGWTALHVQYDLYGMGTVFVGGLLLGVARLKSNSIYLPIMMHAVWSLIATVEVAIYGGVVST
jgi:membrane protease YdiL (CAAX protease family)